MVETSSIDVFQRLSRQLIYAPHARRSDPHLEPFAQRALTVLALVFHLAQREPAAFVPTVEKIVANGLIPLFCQCLSSSDVEIRALFIWATGGASDFEILKVDPFLKNAWLFVEAAVSTHQWHIGVTYVLPYD
jgi:hypothetical protein